MSEKIPFPLSDIYPDLKLPGNVYLYLSKHYIHYRHKDDLIEGDKYKKFEMKKMRFVFIEEVDLEIFKHWSLKIKQLDEKKRYSLFLENESIEQIENVVKIEKSVEDYFSFDLDDTQLNIFDKDAQNLMTEVQSNKNLERALTAMHHHRHTLVDHSLNVANLSVFLAINIGYNQVTLLETVYLGGLLHDFGKTKIHNDVLDLPKTSPKYISAMKMHPDLGSKNLLLNSEFSLEVCRIIREHHEHYDGTGFPKRLRKTKIYPLSTIVGMADFFENQLDLIKGSISRKRKIAIKNLEVEAGKSFDPNMVSKAVAQLKLAYS